MTVNTTPFNRNFVVWIAINCLMALVFAGLYFFLSRQGFSDTSGISYIIFAFFLLFYAINFLNCMYFRSEQKNLLECETPQYVLEGDTILFRGRGLLKNHVNFISKVYGSLKDGKVDQNRSLEVLANRLTRRESFVVLGSNLLITLGLIGTISGLIIAITGLESVMESLDSSGGQMMVSGLKKALQGMGTAFYTTLFGAILGGFFLKLLHQACINMAEEIVEEISLISEIHILPSLKKTLDGQLSGQSAEIKTFVGESRKLIALETKKLAQYLAKVQSAEEYFRKVSELLLLNLKKLDQHRIDLTSKYENQMNQTPLISVLIDINQNLELIKTAAGENNAPRKSGSFWSRLKKG